MVALSETVCLPRLAEITAACRRAGRLFLFIAMAKLQQPGHIYKAKAECPMRNKRHVIAACCAAVVWL